MPAKKSTLKLSGSDDSILEDKDVPTPRSDVDDTIHYISPASSTARSSARTEYEFEPSFYYKEFQFHETKKLSDYTYSSSTVSCVEPKLQRTLAIIKPEAMKYKEVVLRKIEEAGFTIVFQRHLHITPEQASELYAQYYGDPSYPYMVISLSVSPVLVLALAALDAVEKWKNIVGPYKALKEEWFFPLSMRNLFGLQEEMADVLHASETVPEADRENRYFFADSILEPIVQEENKVVDYLALYVNPTLLSGLTHLVKVKPRDPIRHLAEWLLLNNPYQPNFPKYVQLTPT